MMDVLIDRKHCVTHLNEMIQFSWSSSTEMSQISRKRVIASSMSY